MGGTKRVEGWNKILWMCNGGGGSDASPLATDMLLFRNVLGENPRPPPPGGVPRVSIGPPPELAPPFGAPLVLGQKSTSKKKRERGALDSAAFKLAPIQAGRAPPPRLAPMPPPCTPPLPPLGTPLPPPNGWSSAYLSFLINSLIALNVKQ